MKKRSLPLAQVYRLLETGPTVLVTTAYRDHINVMTQSWHTMIDFEPPLVGMIVSNRNDSFRSLKLTKECVINIPTARLRKAVVGCGNTSGKNTDKFKRFDLTPVAASCVKPPLISECYANLECRVINQTLVNKYNLFVVEVLKAWIDPNQKHPRTMHHAGQGIFRIAGETIRLPSKMK